MPNPLKNLFALITVALLATPLSAQQKKETQEPSLQWSFKIKQPFIASPVVDRDLVFAGGLDSTLYALDLATGNVKWKFRTRGQIRSAVCIDNDKLYLTGGDGSIYCLSRSTGKQVWTFVTLGGILGERKYDPADYFYSAPVKHNNTVYAGAGDGRLYALDASSGVMRWNFKANDIVHTTPVVAENKVVFGSSDGHLYAVYEDDGRLAWKFKSAGHKNFPTGEMQGSPVFSQGIIFIGSRDYNLYAVDVNGGYGHWNKAFPFGWATALTATDSALYVGTSDDKLMLALSPKTGREFWRLDTKFNIFGPPAVHQSAVYFGTQMGKLFAVDKKTGQVKWIFTTEGYRAHRLKYFKEDDTFRDDLFSRIKDFNDYVAMLYHIGAFYSTPAVTEKSVVITSTEGIVYCVSK